MRKLTLLPIFLLFIFSNSIFSQSFEATRTSEKIKMDGLLNETSWGAIDKGQEFFKFAPDPGEINEENTHMRVIYDDFAVYFGFMLFEKEEDIFSQVNERDNPNRSDLVSIIIDTYNNASSAMEFAVTIANTQYDAKWTSNGSDSNWDEVWDSQTSKVPGGWSCEIMIPYAALRFPKKDIQSWNFNIVRIQAKKGQRSTLFNVDPEGATFLAQAKPLVGIENIKTPIRLSLYPYATVYGIHSKTKDENGESVNNYGSAYSAGLDIKYGINDAFTLQSTLVPDFGQVRTDDEVLNISPFEVEFNDNRSFFTEGTEIFSKADLFYSRRIGDQPQKYWDVYNNSSVDEQVIRNPAQKRLLNATKISGRTKKGTGIGFFNAVESQSLATIRNIITNEERTEVTSPISNYNIFVVDQNLPNNSSISLVNTNVTRFSESFQNANVIGTEFLFRNKSQKYGFDGNYSYSHLDDKIDATKNTQGYSTYLSLGKMTGNWTGGAEIDAKSPSYDNNDLGINFETNYIETSFNLRYSFFKKWWKLNRANIWSNYFYERRFDSNTFISRHFNTGLWTQTVKQWEFNMWNNYRPAFKDFFEPRVNGRHLNMPGFFNSGLWMTSDRRKKFYMSGFAFGSNSFEKDRYFYEFGAGPNWVVNDRLLIQADMSLSKSLKEVGFAGQIETINGETFILMGQRDRSTIENSFSVDYNINSNVSLSARGRHYWSNVNYHNYYNLKDNGDLEFDDFEGNSSSNFNFANFDVNLRWRFAPGSDIFIVYKGTIRGFEFSDEINYQELDYQTGLQELWSNPSENSLSLRVNYFLDYERSRRAFAQRS
jgi:hypothetical protein